jgi:hypothetical protein
MSDKPPIPPEMVDPFLQFSRNGRWGTCVDCPRDSQYRVYPEFCKETKRYDHQLTVEELADAFNRYKRSQ